MTDDDFLATYARGDYRKEIAELMQAFEPFIDGHPRVIILIALCRMMAAMLGPASPQAREEILDAIPLAISGCLKEMDRMMAELMTEKAKATHQ